MDIVITFLFLIIIGAVIGGFTNSLAIKMLFRPYKPIYVGKWKVPFTPGLIPKRRGELANQLGKMVVDHLLTPESIKRKFLNETFQTEMTKLAQKELERFLEKEETLEEFLGNLGVSDSKVKFEKKMDQFIVDKYENLMNKYREQPIRTVLTPDIQTKLDSKIPLIASFILQKGVDYFSSVEGELRIARMIDDFMRERSGVLGNMLQMFLGNVNLTDKIQPELIKFLNNPGTHDLVTTLIRNEWEKILEWKAEKIEDQFGKEQLLSTVKEYSRKIVNVDKLFESSISDLTSAFKDTLLENIVPKSIQLIGEWLSNRIEVLMERLHLSEIVREQVETFSVERLEEMVLSITRSELKMITYLGALLGGVIGLFQGIVVVFLQ
ncbi:DUF445 family protein [Bacillus sp. 31A1R]|uniref:DUF445 family protein n=1 Tax=Robertmurraya mangrovi TaxID=3098077 RepID=A0ABU5ISS1_9BACI|nr:DUF445 family protein [Bacillus sp. 31A1R]MDZ5470181.1 DUF445 family protein [Bacillus sp. 31A1R]